MTVLTDQAIRRAFESRSAVEIPVGLASAIANETARTSQRPSWPMRLGLPRALRSARPMLLFAVISAAILVVAFSVVGGRPPSPAPTASPSVAPTSTPPGPGAGEVLWFPRPFEYVIPAGANLETGRTDEPGGFWFIDLGGRAPVTSPGVIGRGVTIVAIEKPVIHGCGSIIHRRIRSAPADFLEDLRVQDAIPLSLPLPTILDGRPALLSTVPDQTPKAVGDGPLQTLMPSPPAGSSPTEPGFANCPPLTADAPNRDFHFREGAGMTGWIPLFVPSRLIVADVDGVTVMVQIWADNQVEFDAWLPIATKFVSSIHFRPTPAIE
ncbi:MAG: hypothetical protein ABIP53_04230 [Candidatus Limnocylindrales bacterium]